MKISLKKMFSHQFTTPQAIPAASQQQQQRTANDAQQQQRRGLPQESITGLPIRQQAMQQQNPQPHIKTTRLKLTKAATSKLYYICKFPKPVDFKAMDGEVKIRLKGKEDEAADMEEKPQEEQEAPETEENMNKPKVKRKQKQEYILENTGTPKKAFEAIPEETQDAKYAIFFTRQNPMTGENEFGVLPVSSQWLNFRPRILKSLLAQQVEVAEKQMKQKAEQIEKRMMKIKPSLEQELKHSRKIKKEKEIVDEMDFEEVVDDDEEGEFGKLSREARMEAKRVFGSDEENSESEESEDSDDEDKERKEKEKHSRMEYSKLLKKERGELNEEEEEDELKEKVKEEQKKRKKEAESKAEVKLEEPEMKKIKTESPPLTSSSSSSSAEAKLKQAMLKYLNKKGQVKTSRFKKKFFKDCKTEEEKEQRKQVILQIMKEIGAKTYDEQGHKVIRLDPLVSTTQ